MRPDINHGKCSPIGVFDSGIGGLSVLTAIAQELPNESLVYFADTGYAPYGDRTDQQIVERSIKVTEHLINTGCKAVVLACNTATAAAVTILRERTKLPIIGIEPGIKPAVTLSRSGRIGILATEYTVKSDKFKRLIQPYLSVANIRVQACPGLVERLEMPGDHQDSLDSLLDQYLAPMLEAKIDTLVLGCTHYTFLREAIQRRLPQSVVILDTPTAVAREVRRRLTENNRLCSHIESQNQVRYLSTADDIEQGRAVMSALLGMNIIVEKVRGS